MLNLQQLGQIYHKSLHTPVVPICVYIKYANNTTVNSIQFIWLTFKHSRQIMVLVTDPTNTLFKSLQHFSALDKQPKE